MTEERVATSEKLAEALRVEKAPSGMVRQATEGHYDDFKSELAMPQHQLVRDCRKYGLSKFARRVMDGEFDSQKWESEEWAAGPEGQEVFQEFRDHMGGK